MEDFRLLSKDILEFTIFERFLKIVEVYESKIAIQARESSTTYGELLAQTYPITYFLNCEIEKDTPIALLLPQGSQFIAGMFGCLAAGNPYAPLDSAYPFERLRLMLESINSPVILACRETHTLATSLMGTAGRIILIEDLAIPMLPPSIRSTVDSNGYLLFTSGSTGRPKAVLESQRNILHNVIRQTNSFAISSNDRQLFLYTCGVYGGARDIFSTLLNGATLCHYDIKVEDNSHFGAWIKNNKISIFCSVASVFRHFQGYLNNVDELISVRIVKLGGEASRRSDVDFFKKMFPEECVFYTGLASTETGTTCQYPITKNTIINSELLPLGKPALGTEIFILGSDGQPVPQGEVGEIVIGSDFLSLGYYGQPDETQKRFIQIGGKRHYKTGDLGRIDEAGCLWHAGRGDQQVKIRGNRIELGEIESLVLKNFEIADIASSVINNDNGEPEIALFIVPKIGQSLDANNLRLTLSKLVPEFMVPSKFIILEKFERTVNGKIDRSKLSQLSKNILPVKSTVGFDFWSATLANIWKQVLKLDSCQLQDNFFSVGGHSLRIIQLINEVRRQLGTKIPIKEFLKKPTLNQLISLVLDSSLQDTSSLQSFCEKENENCLLMLPGEELGFSLRCLKEELKSSGTVLISEYSNYSTDVVFNVDVLAEHIVDDACAFFKNKVIRILGYSFGSLLALKVTEVLLRRNYNVDTIFIINAESPFFKMPEMEMKNLLVGSNVRQKPNSIRLRTEIVKNAEKNLRETWSSTFQFQGDALIFQSSLVPTDQQVANVAAWKRNLPSLRVENVNPESAEFLNSKNSAEMGRKIDRILIEKVKRVAA